MNYIVLKPIILNGTAYMIGDRIPDTAILARRAPMLIAEKYIARVQEEERPEEAVIASVVKSSDEVPTAQARKKPKLKKPEE